MLVNTLHSSMLTSPARTITGKVELYTGSTLTSTFLGSDKLANFTVNRAGDTKFFGYGISQELELHLIDNKRECTVCKDNVLRSYFGVDGDYVTTTPKFYVTDVTRDENTNAITVKASDVIYKARLHTLNEIILEPPYTIRQLASAIAQFLGLTVSIVNVTDNCFDTSYEEGGNFSGNELLRAVLDDIAEATQTIYYIDSSDNLVFKRLDVNGAAVTIIDKSNYFTLKAKDALTLTSICHTTELGDNLTAPPEPALGVTQYVRDNALWNLRTDLNILLDNAVAAIGGLTIAPFACDWRGNYLLEIGDKISFAAKEGTVTTYLLNDQYTYNGGLKGLSSWETSTQEETESNPTNLGDKINQTFARVDKLEQNITLYVGDIVQEQLGGALTDVEGRVSKLELTTEGIDSTVKELQSTTNTHTTKIGQLEIDADAITTKVSSLETETSTSIDSLNDRVTSISQEAALKVTSEEVGILIERTLSEGVDKVVTSSKKFTFDDNGLSIVSNSSNITTEITENGMKIIRAGEEVLTADNEGVKAEDLHATTYLIIGETSRLEDRNNRTACFWIKEG